VASELEQHACIYLEHSYRVSDVDSFTSAVYMGLNSVARSRI